MECAVEVTTAFCKAVLGRTGGWVEHNLLLLKQAAVTSPGKFSGNTSRPGRIERCSTPEFLHRSLACQQGTRPEPASYPSGPALARHACTLGLCRWEGMRRAALEITSPLGVRPCRMAMAPSATPQVREQLQTSQPHPRNVETRGSRW